MSTNTAAAAKTTMTKAESKTWILNRDEVRDILGDKLTVIARDIKPQPELQSISISRGWVWSKPRSKSPYATVWSNSSDPTGFAGKLIPYCPFGEAGEIVAVREGIVVRNIGPGRLQISYMTDDSPVNLFCLPSWIERPQTTWTPRRMSMFYCRLWIKIESVEAVLRERGVWEWQVDFHVHRKGQIDFS